ncbi:hypothetical protein AGLY_012480 [Aphis glycines]|uniref:Uncharacterized protein n=1 Tax=Aphis glycines TaxID=307491 RepID=A0A6G0TAU0_APHGL|nr:hypothetical protein AGLY_012480 [Aphis glycines]
MTISKLLNKQCYFIMTVNILLINIIIIHSQQSHFEQVCTKISHCLTVCHVCSKIILYYIPESYFPVQYFPIYYFPMNLLLFPCIIFLYITFLILIFPLNNFPDFIVPLNNFPGFYSPSKNPMGIDTLKSTYKLELYKICQGSLFLKIFYVQITEICFKLIWMWSREENIEKRRRVILKFIEICTLYTHLILWLPLTYVKIICYMIYNRGDLHNVPESREGMN